MTPEITQAQTCTCEGLGELKTRVDKLEDRIDKQAENSQQLEVSLVLIQKDLEFIKDKISQKSKFNGNIVNTIINTAIAILMAYLAVKVGIA